MPSSFSLPLRRDRGGLILATWTTAAAVQLFGPSSQQHWVFLAIVGLQAAVGAVMVYARRHELVMKAIWIWVVVAMVFTAITGYVEGPGGGQLSSTAGSVALAGAAVSLMCYGVFAAYVAFPLVSVAVARPPTLAIFGGFGTMAMAYVWIVTDRPTVQLVVLLVIAALSTLVTLLAVTLSSKTFRRLGRPAESMLGWAAVVFGLGQAIAMGLRAADVSSAVRLSGIIVANGLILAALANRAGYLVGTRVAAFSDHDRHSPASAVFVVFILGDVLFAELSRVRHGLWVVIGLVLGVVLQTTLVIWAGVELLNRGSIADVVRRHRVARWVRAAIDRDAIEFRYRGVRRLRDDVVVAVTMAPMLQRRRGDVVDGDELLAGARSARRSGELDELLILNAAHERARLVAEIGVNAPFVGVQVSSDLLDRPADVARVVERCDRSELSGEGLVLQISASYVSIDWEVMSAAVEQFRERGFLVAVSDFGGGLANLKLLSRLTFDVLGFDAQFVELAAKTARGATVAEAAIRTAQSVGTLVWGAGVSDLGWLPDLKRLGFDLVSGPAVDSAEAFVRNGASAVVVNRDVRGSSSTTV